MHRGFGRGVTRHRLDRREANDAAHLRDRPGLAGYKLWREGPNAGTNPSKGMTLHASIFFGFAALRAFLSVIERAEQLSSHPGVSGAAGMPNMEVHLERVVGGRKWRWKNLKWRGSA